MVKPMEDKPLWNIKAVLADAKRLRESAIEEEHQRLHAAAVLLRTGTFARVSVDGKDYVKEADGTVHEVKQGA